MAYFTINGVSISQYIAYNGIKRTRNDIEAPDAGRTMDGTWHRGRAASKIKLDVTCVPMKDSALRVVLALIQPEIVTVRYDDPLLGRVSKTMYANNNSAISKRAYDNGAQLWSGVSFSLEEV